MCDVRTSGRSGTRPPWCRLYVITLLGLALFGMVDVEMPEGSARTVLDVAAAVVVFGAMAVWVRSNRVALDLGREGDSATGRHPVPVIAGPQGPPARVGVPTAGHLATQNGAERDALAGSGRDVGTSR